MTINKWLGVAQSLAEQRVMTPENIFPGSVWQLRVGNSTYTFEYPATIEIRNLTDSDKARRVVEGVIAAYEGSGQQFAGGADGTSLTLSSDVFQGKWSLLARGPSDGTPLDVELTASDPTRARVSVVQLQAGRASANQVIRVRWPDRPLSGTLNLRYEDEETSVAYNASAAAVEAALEALGNIGAGNVSVRGDYTTYYDITFTGALAARSAGKLSAWSVDATGVAAVTTELVTSARNERYTYILSKPDGDSDSLHQFSFNGETGHLFTGASTADEIRAAAEAVPTIGAGNVEVVELPDGTFQVAMVGIFVGVVATGLTVSTSSGTALTLTAQNTPTYGERKTKLRYTLNNAPSSGTFSFEADGTTYGPVTWPPLPVDVNAVLGGSGYLCLSVGEGLYRAMVIELEAILPTRDIDLPILQMDVSALVGTYAMDVRTVAQARAARNEVQQITLATDPVGGTFTLSFNGDTTAGIAYNAAAGTIQTALVALSSVGVGGARVSGQTGGPWLVEFIGANGAIDQPLITGDATLLTLGSTAAVTTTQLAVPTGPNWWTNVRNWSLGRVPIIGDTAVFEGSAVPCLYGISNVPAFDGIDIYRSYTGAGIGLPPIKADGSPETLPAALSLSSNAGDFVLRIGLGDEGAGPALVRIDGQLQRIVASVFYTQSSVNDGTYAVMLSGLLDELNVGDAIVGVGVTAGATGAISKLRMRQRGNQDGAVVEWGELVTADDVQVQLGTLRAGTAPKALFMVGGEAIVRGTGDLDSMVVRDSTVRWLAGGKFGKQGLVTSLALDGSNQAVITSAAHGLEDGSRVFLSGVKGVQGLPDAYYSVADVTANTFTLVGTAPTIPFGATAPTTVASFYQTNTARWGLADAIVIGAAATVDMSEQAQIRTLGAPVVIQAADAVLNDPLVTIPDLRLRYDPGALEETMGTRIVIRRDERAAASANAGYAGGAGGFVVSEIP